MGFRRLRNWIARPIGWLLAVMGLAVLVIAAMLAAPVTRPPENPSILAGVLSIDRSGLPQPTRFQARDGTELAYRLYPGVNGADETVAILVHGSGGSSTAMNSVAKALAASGITAVSLDIRGHGLSGTRGDIGYIGQIDDDLADLLAGLGDRYSSARIVLVGHSSGGGFALRIAGGPVGQAFDRVVLLAPYLGPFAPTSLQPDGDARWAEPDVPRIIALDILGSMGITCCEALPVIAFALAPGSESVATPTYSYRLLSNFGAPEDYAGAFGAARGTVTIIAGEADTLMDSSKYADVVEGIDPEVGVQVLPGVDHMGLIHDPAALAAIVSAAKGG